MIQSGKGEPSANSSPFLEEKGYYVYEVIVDEVVRYVGKGRGRRAKRHVGIAEAVTRNKKHKYARSRFYRKLGEAIDAGSKVDVRYVATLLSSEEAFQREINLISTYGLGNLWNSTPGGDGLDSGTAQAIALQRWVDPKERARQSERLKLAYNDPHVRERHRSALRRDLSAEERQVRAKNANSRWARPGERDRQAIASRAIRAGIAAKRNATIHCSVLSFGC